MSPWQCSLKIFGVTIDYLENVKFFMFAESTGHPKKTFTFMYSLYRIAQGKKLAGIN
jgi:hypothetical protein